MLLVEWERVSRLRDDGAEDLLLQHWRETALHHEDVPLDPDWSRVFCLEREGWLKVASLRRYGELIGYAVFTIARHLHFRSSVYATCNALYVLPEHRGYAGGKLVVETERMLRALDVTKVVHQAPVSRGKKLGALLERLGYKHTEDFYCKLME